MNNGLAAIITLAIFIIGLGGTPVLAGSSQSKASGNKATVRVYYPNPAVGNKVLISFKAHVLETNYEQNYHVMEVSQRELDLLARAGLRVEADLQGTLQQMPKTPSLSQTAETTDAIPNYTCYRTVEETYAAAEQIVRDHPNLATWINVGNSWKKSENVGGYDMKVLILTHSATPGPKPKLFLTGAIHAREYTTAELVTRFAEYLVNNYGTDADATWILNHHEVHLMLQTNPDGRKQAEAGFWWRKNTNQNYCSPTSNYRGADLNRNFSFQWSCCGGSSDNECDETYHGPSASSEPEIQAVEGYMASIFPAQRGPQLTDPAPDDATGIYLDVHSYGRMILWPWSHTSATAPNATKLQTLGRKFAYWSGYTPGQSVGLYPNDGASDDHAYGTFGVAAYTIELGTAYFQSCTEFENTILPANIPALIYAAKVARTPYLTPSGPDVTNLSLSGNSVPAGTKVTLSATVDDTRYNNSNGTEPAQNVAAAEYYIDLPPWAAGSTAFAMKASDGLFGSTIESVTATIDTTSWNQGRHIIFVRGKDADNNWGAFSAVFLTISGTVPLPPTGFNGSTGWENGEAEGAVDDVLYSQAVGPHPGGSKPECSRRTGERAKSGSYALMIAGSSEADYAYCYYQVFDNLSIPVTHKTKIGYYIYHSAGTPQVAVDGYFTDGSTIRDSGIKDQNGVSIHPAARNEFMNQWVYVEVDLSPVAGKTIKTLMFAFDNGGNKYHGPYRAYVDDLRVFEEGGGGGNCIVGVPGNRWKGEYFNNENLSGSPAMVKDEGDGVLDKQWGAGSPGSDCGIGVDHFSVRFTKVHNFAPGMYTFTMSVDDGGRFYIDGEKKLEGWKDQSETPYTTGQIALSGDHTLKLEYYENGGFATAKLSWTKVGDLPITTCQADVPGNHWKGEYFKNQDLSGVPAMVKDDGDGALDKQWGTTSPGSDCGIGVDHFSVRWTKVQNFPAGLYTFTLSVDDGGRFYLDGEKKLEGWKDQSETPYTTGPIALSGDHTLKLEYYENAGLATARLSWTKVGELPITTCQANVPGNHWKGEYFKNQDLSGVPAMVKDDGDGALDKQWGTTSPGSDCGIGVDHFSVRWTKVQNFPAGLYTFTMSVDDGGRFYLDGEKKLESWKDQAEAAYTTGQIALSGDHTLKLEYYENAGDATARLSWTR